MARDATELAELQRRLGEHLATWRKAARLKQAQVGQAAHVDRTTVSHIEGGRARASDQFWSLADAACGANGELIDQHRRFEAARLAYQARVQEAELAESRAKSARLQDLPALVIPERPHLARPGETIEHMRRLYRTDVGAETIEQLHQVAEELCCEYAWRDAEALKADADHWLQYIARLKDGPCTFKEHKELLMISGWLMLLIGCVEYDLGRKRQAESWRQSAKKIGEDIGHGPIIAWAFEMSAWFALTQGDLHKVMAFSRAGIDAAPHTSVAVQLSAQSAKAAARMGERETVHHILDEGYRLLGSMPPPARPENHFDIDPAKWDFYAMDCFRIATEDRRASEHAHEVLRISRRPDGTDRSPMRATEARLTLAIVALRQGDLDIAASWTQDALSASRRSADSMTMVVNELVRELNRLFPKDPAARTIIEPVKQARLELRAD